MFLRNLISVTIFLVFLTVKSSGLGPQTYFQHFTTNDGLPTSQIYEAMQDSDGYMWFATDRGVVRYNGYEFKTFGTKEGLLDNVVFRLFQDIKGRIWMITFSGRVFFYEGGKINAYRYNDRIKGLINGSFQLSIFVDKNENVYIGSTYGQYLINSKGIVTIRIKPHNINNIPFISIDERVDSRKADAIGTGLKPGYTTRLLHLTKNGATSFIFQNKTDGKLCAVRLKNDRLLFSIGTTIFELKNKSFLKVGEVPHGIINMTEDLFQNLWVCTKNGLYFFDSTTDLSKSKSYLHGNYISNIMQDKENGYWVTSINDGIFYLPNHEVKNYVSNDRMQAPQALTCDDKYIYAGYFPAALAKINTTEMTVFDKKFESPTITSLYFDREDLSLYVGNDNITYLSKNKFNYIKYARTKNATINFTRNKFGLFSGCYDKLLQITNDSITELCKLNSKMTCIFSNTDNNLIIGSIDGVVKFDIKNNKFYQFNDRLSNFRIDDIDTINESLCFATVGHGLMIMMKDSSLKTIGESNGLCSNTIRKIAIDRGKIWCASNNGISVIEFSDFSKFTYEIKNIGIKEGIPDNEINDIAILNDTVWLASKKGIVFFSSHSDFENKYSPIVKFTRFQVNNSDTTISDKYIFPYKLNTFSIGFESPMFKSRKNQSYKYILFNGHDSIVGTTINREVEFLSLDPGKYSLSVKAMNNSGLWSKQPAVLSFTILSPWWKTIWFRTIIFILLMISIYIFYKRRILLFQEKYDNEKKQASLQLTAMRAQMNPHFIFNVMNSIRNYMQENDLASAEKYLTSFAKLVRYTLDNSSVQEVSLEEELQALRSYAFLEMQRFEDGFQFEIIIDPEIDTDDIMVPSLLLQPFVENAIKHGIDKLAGKGKIFIYVQKKNQYILIAIEDNGIGRIDSANWNSENRGKHTSFGSRLTFERIEAFNKAYNKGIKAEIIDLKDKNQASIGTRVEIELS